jgi:adenosylcobinamide-GDP ribazoletransferase
MKPLLAALRFLTILPIPGTWGTDEGDLARSVPYFPVVGLLLGGIAAAASWAIGRTTTPPLLASLALVVLLATFSGCLHLDGLSDSADGMLSSRPRERMLEIMRDSHMGPMGMIAVLVVVLAKFSALASLEPDARWPAALLMPLAGRCALVAHMAWLPYARSTGLATIFYQRSHRLTAAWSLTLLAAVSAGLFGARGLIVWAVCLAVMLVAARYVDRKLGGATGDTLGAVCELVETIPAVILAICPLPLARWTP